MKNIKIGKKVQIIIVTLFCYIHCSGQQQPSEKIDYQSEILKIVYYGQSGGKDGSFEFLAITKDSISYKSGVRLYNTKNEKHKLNVPATWNDLIASVKLENINNIKNGKSRMPSDGRDYGISIETRDKNYRLVNVKHDSNYEKIKDLIEKINAIWLVMGDNNREQPIFIF